MKQVCVCYLTLKQGLKCPGFSPSIFGVFIRIFIYYDGVKVFTWCVFLKKQLTSRIPVYLHLKHFFTRISSLGCLKMRTLFKQCLKPKIDNHRICNLVFFFFFSSVIMGETDILPKSLPYRHLKKNHQIVTFTPSKGICVPKFCITLSDDPCSVLCTSYFLLVRHFGNPQEGH